MRLPHYHRPVFFCIWFIVSVFVVPGPGGGFVRADEAGVGPVRVFVSILPQKYFVERVGKERVDVSVLLPPGKSPVQFSPTPGDVSRLARAGLFFRIGVPFENTLMPKLENTGRGLRVVDMRQGVELRKINAHEGGACDHETGSGHDPHIWLDPLLVIGQAETIATALCDIDPGHCSAYRDNYRDFKEDLQDLHQRLSILLEPVRGKTFFTFHPAFGYFADAYGLRQEAVETSGKSPRPRELAALIDRAGAEKAAVIFVQPQFDDKAARAVAGAIGGKVVPLDPLAVDYPRNMEKMAVEIRRALLEEGREKK